MKVGKKSRTHRALTQKASAVSVPDDYPWIVLGALVKDLVTAGSLSADDGLLVSQIIRDRDRYALHTLDDIWGLQCITSWETWPRPEEVRARRLLAGLLKKYPFESDADARRDLALKKFLEAEQACATFNHGGYTRLTANGEWVAGVLTRARSFIKSVLGDRPDFRKLVPWVRFGPGATLDGNRHSTSEFFKYSEWPYTVTAGCERYARFVIETDQRWMGALMESYRHRKGIPMQYPLNMREFWSSILTKVDGNRIGFVPKTSTVDRSIAVEPLLNLRLQLGVDGFIRRSLKRYDIDLDSQEKNQVLASLGSEPRTNNRYSTIDLSAASDTVSLKLCEILLPDEWYSFLYDLRSPVGYIAGHGKIEYEKISSMGNGYTFVLESLIFASLVFGVLKEAEGTVSFVKDMAVYGDDLIVPEKHYDEVVRVLQYAGFTVNDDKSFKTGLVKESCGTDWFEGHQVRPVALTCKPSTVMDLFVDYNRLQRVLSLYFGVPLGDSWVCQKISSWIPPFFMRFRGPVSDESFSTHLHTHEYKLYGCYQHGRWRYHRLTLRPVLVESDAYWSFNFRKLMHSLSGAPLSTSPFHKGLESGNRFAIALKDDNVMVGQSRKPAESTWQVMYVDATHGAQFRQTLVGENVTPLQKRLSKLFALESRY